MHLSKPAVVVAALFFHSTTATFGYGGWGGDSSYSTPDNTNNKCSSEQTKGYNWDGLSSGSFDSYGSNQFSKWSCTNSFGKRDLLTKRSFQAKCISSNLDDEPTIGCDGEDSMSIDKYEVSSSEDTDIECHYEMPDQTVCKEYHSCKSGGTVIQNTQCGGAKSVTFKPAESFKGKGCSIGVHSIGFNCGTASSTAPVASKTESIPVYGSSLPPTYETTSSASSTEAAPTSSEVQITTDTTPYTSPSSTESTTSTSSSSESTTETAPVYDSTTEATSTSAASTESVPSYDTTSSTSSSASETAPAETTSQSPSSSGSSSCLAGYGSSCSTEATSTSTEETGRETSPVETSASEYSTSSTPSTTSSSESSAVTGSTTSSEPFTLTGIPTYSSYNTGTGGTVSSYNTSLTYKVPAYTQSSSTVVEATSITSYSSYSTGTIYSTTCETLTSSGSITTLTKSYAVSTTVAAVTSPGKESSPVETSSSSTITYSGPEPSSPALLPRCLNTWMYLTDCSSNSDSDCYCKNSDYINKVYGCLSSWSQSVDNATNGVSYLMGLCAPYISENPAIITACPSTITPAAYTPPATTSITSTLTPTSTITLQSTIISSLTISTAPASTEVSPPNSSPAPTTPASVPCTTITYSQTLTLPATYPSGTSQGSTIPSSSITSAIITTITVPQVQITTYTVTESGSVITAPGLGYGVPSTETTGRVTPTAAPAMTSASSVYGSVGFTKSVSATSGVPSGIVPYEGAGVKGRTLSFEIVGFWALVGGLLAVL